MNVYYTILIIIIIIVLAIYLFVSNKNKNSTIESFTSNTNNEMNNFVSPDKYNQLELRDININTETPLDPTIVDEEVKKCSSLKSCGDLDGTNCGMCLANGKIMYGNERGPFVDVCPSGWVKSSYQCTKIKEREICKKVRNCNEMIGEASICGWCPTTGKAFASKKDASGKLVPKYPEEDQCKTMGQLGSVEDLALYQQSECSKVAGDYPCLGSNSETGPHNTQCLNKLWASAGCSSKGSAAPSNLNPGSEILTSWNNKSWTAVLEDMKTYNKLANSNDWNTAKEYKEKCYGIAADPCDDKISPKPAECYQKKFTEFGCKVQGSQYPKSSLNNISIENYQTQIKTLINKAHNPTLPYDERNNAYKGCYGIEIPKPPPPPKIQRLELNPQDYIMYGNWILGTRLVNKIIVEENSILYLIEDGRFTKIVKEQGISQTPFYYVGKIKDYKQGMKLTSAPNGVYKIKENSDNKRTPSNWSCVKNISVPLRKNKYGDVECMSTNGTGCMWSGNCNTKLKTPSSKINPLSCGAQHKSIYGITGYERNNHWCSIGGVNIVQPNSDYIGCYKDSPDYDLPVLAHLGRNFNKEQCKNEAIKRGYKYYGLQYGKNNSNKANCTMGNSYGKHGKASNCYVANEDKNVYGGPWSNAVYKV